MRMGTVCVIVTLASSCATTLKSKPIAQVKPELKKKEYVSYDGDHFGYKKWLPEKEPVKTVIIGVHGISGHAGDYDNLGGFLQKHAQSAALYAAETRGQGRDPKAERRGDIHKAKEWTKDLYTFTDLVRALYPKAKVVWFGESMGSLIVMNAYSNTPLGSKKPDAMVISSPIANLQSKVAGWKVNALRVATFLIPTLRISLESLSSGEKAQVTQQDIHKEQSAKNEWYIPRYTLRLLMELGDLAESMPTLAKQVRCPVLVLHGGNDIFTSKESVEGFYQHFPDTISKERKYYAEAYHLLMYDENRDQIFKDAAAWVSELK